MLKQRKRKDKAITGISRIEAANLALEQARLSHEKYIIMRHANDFEDAIDNYICAIKLNPELSQTYYRLATLMWEKGEISIDTAIAHCEKAVKLAPKNSNAHLYFGFFLKMARQYEGAEKEFKSAIDANPLTAGRPRIILALFLLEKMVRDKLSLVEFVKSIYYLFSGSIMMFWDKPALTMLYKSFYDKFATLVYKSIGKVFEKTKNYSMAIKTYDIAAESTGRNEIFLNRIGDISVKKECPEIAVDSYRKALEAKPYDREILIKLATVIQTYYNDNIDEAIDCYNKLLVIEPTNGQIYYELGHLYLQKNDKMNACQAFKLAVTHDSENPFYQNSLGFSLIQLEQYEEAIEHYQIAINKNPDNQWTAIVCQALGAIYAQIMENPEAAIELYHTALVLDPNSAQSHISIGDIYFEKGDLDNAIKSYLEAIKIDDKNPKAFGKCAIALWENDFIEEAIVAYHKAIAIDENYELAQNNLGVAYLDGIGNVKEAIPCFEKAIEINPNYTLAYFNLGRAYQMADKSHEAVEAYKMALELNKITEEIEEKDILERIHKIFEV